MRTLVTRIKRYLLHPQTGAGLLYAALAIWILADGAAGLVTGERPPPAGIPDLALLWRMVSFAVSAWLAFVLLRRNPVRNALRRVLLVGVVHAAGAVRFYEPGMVVLSILPLFALLPAWLLPAGPDRE